MAKGPAKKSAKKVQRPVAKAKAQPKPPAKSKAPAPKAKATAKPVAKPIAKKEAAKPAAPVIRYSNPVMPTPPPPIQVIKAPAAEALTLFEKGMAALQKHDYKAGLATFERIVTDFPSEGPLADRARVYLELAKRELARRPAGSGTIEERLTAATHALNNNNDVEAARLALGVLKEDAAQDLAEYLLAVVAARGNDISTALAHLGSAIKINPECRLQARQDEEFDPLMDSDEFHALIEAPSTPTASAAVPLPKRPVRRATI